MGKLTVYGVELSPPVRTVLLTLKALDLPYEFVTVNLTEGEHRTPAYLQKNPQHTVPTLEDDGHFIWDSHAIAAYLVNKYGKTDDLYPKDPLQRAVVDQRLHFESGVIISALGNITRPIWLKNETHVPKEKIEKVAEGYDFLEIFLENRTYIAGEKLTIADFSLVPSLLSSTIFLEIDAQKYPRLSAWLKRIQSLPYFAEVNDKGHATLKAILESKNLTIERE